MLLKPISVAAAGFAVASAFLLPPNVHMSEIPELMNIFEPSSQDLDLRCPGCPMQASDGSKAQVASVANHLKLHFTVDDNRLQVNGFDLYPAINPFGKLNAPQVADGKVDTVAAELRKHPRPSSSQSPQLGFNVRVRRKHVDKSTGFQAIALDLQIFEIGSTFVGGIPNVHINLIKAADGSVIIGSIKETASRAHVVSYKAKMEKCTTVLCKWRMMAAAHMGQLKSHGCAMMGKLGHKAHHGHSRPGHHHHNGTQSAWEGHTWHKLVKQLVKYVLYPILLGMVVGVGVCVIGMSVGTIIVACWRIFVRRQTPAAAFGAPFHRRCRRHRRSSRAHKAAPVDAEVAATEEKSSLIEHQEDAPPSYNDEEVKKTDA